MTASRSSGDARRQSAGLTEALRLRRLAKRAPTDADRPLPKPFPWRKVKLLPGQLDFDDNECGTEEEGEEIA